VERFPAIPGLRTALAFLYGEIGRESDARTQFEQVAAKNFTDMVRDQGWLGSMTNLSQVAFFLKDKERARLLYELLLPYAGRNAIVGSANDCFGAVARYLGLLATTMERWDEAARHFADALAMNERVGARLFVAHTQYDYATMLLTGNARGDQAHAQPLLDQALATAQELGMPRLEQKIVSLVQSSKFEVQSIEDRNQYLEVRSPKPKVQSPTEKERSSRSQTLDSGTWTPDALPNFLRREGDYWTVGYDGTAVRLQDAKGLTHLVCLLRESRREFHVLDLLAMTDGVPSESSDAGQHEKQALQLHLTTELAEARTLPDRRARTVYQQRLQVLREELAEAERFNDSGRVRTLQIELDFLTREVAAAYGANTYARRRNEDTEKVRKTVTHRIRTVLTKIKRVHPSLWRHLHVSLKTGTFCSYNPEKFTDWEV
jgi:tetratricopeptide (TPR) repeat protein